jgi:pyridoxal 5'-phosphate synthase pdxT subunit
VVSHSPLRVGVLALQGDVAEHQRTLNQLGAESLEVRNPEQLEAVDALVLPGGESTTMSLLLDSSGLAEPLEKRLADGMPAFGTCAGMILLAQEILDGRADQHRFGAIDISVRRNAFGRQVDSFETTLDVVGMDDPMPAVFIRAPLVERTGPGVEVLATVSRGGVERPVVCREGRVLVAAYHPELSGDPRLHQLFLQTVAA